MEEDAQGPQPKRRRLWLALAMVLALLAVLVVPPLLSMSRYKSRITRLMATSLGRPVRLSSVELRLLPRPGFVLTDLTVEEDPAFGAEPLLHADTVAASFRLLALWGGRLEISRVSVDEASLNLVRNGEGVWNLDPLFRTAAAKAGPEADGTQARHAVPLPYLEATNSRINVKEGAEKLPFSLVNTDLSFWQEAPGDWRVRLRGQPARTDVSLDLYDTGIVRLEASLRGAPLLRQMPLHLDLEWREAQLGQLSRLVTGSDPGWRGDLTGELHLDGTADKARITTRLRAEGVHRVEFAPASPLDFDAQCGFVYHFYERAIENLACDSPLGNGRIHLAGELPGKGGKPHFSIALDRIPVQAGLDALRTVRRGLGPGLDARGTVSGKIMYAEVSAEVGAGASGKKKAVDRRRPNRNARNGSPVQPAGPLTGSLTVDGLVLSGDGLSRPIQFPRMVFEPVAAAPSQQADQVPGQSRGQKSEQPPSLVSSSAWSPPLAATVAIPAGGSGPLSVVSRLSLSGYLVAVHGQASLARARELAHMAGGSRATALDALAGDPVLVNLSAEGPWWPAERIPFTPVLPSGPADSQAGSQPTPSAPGADRLTGTVILRNVNWKPDFLANRVNIAQATLHFGGGEDSGEGNGGAVWWDPVNFSYGTLKGTASLTMAADCGAEQPCLPHFELQFGELDAGVLQAAILGAREKGTLLSGLMARLRPSAGPVWPRLEGTVKADSLILGPVTLREPSADLRVAQNGAEITSFDAGLLGGRVHGTGTLQVAAASEGKPAYSLQGSLEKLSPAEVGQLLGMRWKGSAFDAEGKIGLAGFTGEDLAASAKGTLHFEWRHGAISGPVHAEGDDQDRGGKTAGSSGSSDSVWLVPSVLARFDLWTADAEIADGRVALKQNQVTAGARKRAVDASLTLGEPPSVTFAPVKETVAKTP